MTEENQNEAPKKFVKVHNILHISPHDEKDSYQRPIDVKIDEIRTKLRAMVKAKIRHRSRSESESKSEKNESWNEKQGRNLLQLYNILMCPKATGPSNTLPNIKKKEQKLPLTIQKTKPQGDCFIYKARIQLNEDEQNLADKREIENRPPRGKFNLNLQQEFLREQHKHLRLVSNTEQVKSINSVSLMSKRTEKGKVITGRKTQILKRIYEEEEYEKQYREEYCRKLKKKILSQPHIYKDMSNSTVAGREVTQLKMAYSSHFKKQTIIPPKNKIKLIQLTNSHRDFVNFISVCNQFYYDPCAGSFTYFVGRGNNPDIVRRVLRKRGWTEVNNAEQANFVWTQRKNSAILDSMNPLSFVESSCKKLKIREFFYFCNKNGQSVEENNSHFMNLILEKSQISIEQEPTSQNNKKNTRTKVSFPQKKMYTLKPNQKIQIHNHFVNHHEVAYKQALFWNMKSYYEEKGVDPFQHIPLTFHIKNINDSEWNRFRKSYEEAEKQEQLWIVKPAENTNRGTGIYVKNSIEEIRTFIQEKQMEKPLSGFIIQKYLMPLLYNKRKFDIRCYMLVTVVNRKLRTYWYEEGYCRTSSKIFSAKNLKNKYIHLTNDAVQKNGQDFGKFQPGNKLSFQDISKYIQKNQTSYKFEADIYPSMVDLARDSIAATAQKLHNLDHNFCFQIFGLDYMIDEAGKVWLIEVNRNPCLETSTSLLCRIISNMMDDAFRIAVDPIFPVDETAKNGKLLDADVFDANCFKLIYETQLTGSEKVSSYEKEDKEEKDDDFNQ